MSNGPVPPKRRGCVFYGCLTLSILLLIGAVVGYLAVRYALKAANRFVNEYTETTPVQLEKVEISAADLKALQERVKSFTEALESQQAAEELVLSARDLNALIANDAQFKGLKDKVVISIEDDRVKGQVSLPLKDIGPLKLNGRYLNGTATFRVSLQSGILVVKLDDVQVKGKPLPSVLLSQLQAENLAKDVQNDPETAEKIEKFESIQIKDGSIIMKNKVK